MITCTHCGEETDTNQMHPNDAACGGQYARCQHCDKRICIYTDIVREISTNTKK